MNIPIFLASDENYAPYLCTTLYSILMNTASYIDFYILDGGIDNNTRSLISMSLEKFKNFSIKYFDMTNFGLERFPNKRHYSLNTFSRYFIPHLASNLEKVIYIDVDIIVKSDILKLYNIDLEGKALAAVPENFYKLNGLYVKEHIKSDFENVDNYFNAGVMLLNNKQFAENNYSDKLINMTIELYDKLSCPDQDIFNIMFEHNHKLIDYKFNYMPDFIKLYNKISSGLGNKLDKKSIIIHYTAGKPWKHKRTRLSNEFWRIAYKTKFKERIKKEYLKHHKKEKKPFLPFIFSVQNLNNHTIWTILGLKCKFRNRQKGCQN